KTLGDSPAHLRLWKTLDHLAEVFWNATLRRVESHSRTLRLGDPESSRAGGGPESRRAFSVFHCASEPRLETVSRTDLGAKRRSRASLRQLSRRCQWLPANLPRFHRPRNRQVSSPQHQTRIPCDEKSLH